MTERGRGGNPAASRPSAENATSPKVRNDLMEGKADTARLVTTSARPVRALCITLLTVLASASPSWAQFGAYPVVMSFDRGEPETQILTVLNESVDPMLVRLYLGDFDQQPGGENQFGKLGAHPMSCAGRLSMFPESVNLEAGTSAQVRVTMAEGSGVCWSALFVERGVPEEQFKIAHRIAIKVHAHPPEARAEARVLEVQVEPDDAGIATVVTLDNTGTRNLRPAGTLQVRSLTGDVVHSQEIPPFSVLPGHRRVVRIPLPLDLPPGDLLSIPILDIGQDDLLGGQASFQVAAVRER